MEHLAYVAPGPVGGGQAGSGATQICRPDRSSTLGRGWRRWAIVVLLLTALLGAGLVARQQVDVGAMPDSIGCTLGILGGAGTAYLLVAAPPAGAFQVIVTGALGLGTVASIIDACGAWITVDLANRLNIFGPCTYHCVPNSGGGSW